MLCYIILYHCCCHHISYDMKNTEELFLYIIKEFYYDLIISEFVLSLPLLLLAAIYKHQSTDTTKAKVTRNKFTAAEKTLCCVRPFPFLLYYEDYGCCAKQLLLCAQTNCCCVLKNKQSLNNLPHSMTLVAGWMEPRI